MYLSTTTSNCSNKVSLKESIKILKDAGFKAYDCSLFGNTAARKLSDSENYREQALEIRQYADSLGIICNQAHAFFHSSTGNKEQDDVIFGKIVRDMEVASILGAKIIVVHPKQHLTYAEHAEELFKLNVEFYKSLIPYCEKFGIKVATENMFQWNSGTNAPIDSTCSRAWEFCKYIDAIDSEWIVGCLDIGHASLMGCDIAEFIKTMGNKRLQALHVHDNDRHFDMHTMPFMQKIDFFAVTKALGEIDYKGDFTYEADCFLEGFPLELYPSALKLMNSVGEYLANQIEINR